MEEKGIEIIKFSNRTIQRFSSSFKQLVLEEYLSTSISKSSIQRKYNLKGNSTISKWLQSYGYTDKTTSINGKFASDNYLVLKKDLLDLQGLDKAELIAKIKALETQLSLAQLHQDGLSKMIDIAEKDLKVSIRKKSDTK